VRYNADLSGVGLKDSGVPAVDPASIQKMDAVETFPVLLQIGRANAQKVDVQHFGTFLVKPAIRFEACMVRCPAISS